MTEKEFLEWWSALVSRLKPGTEVFHWSAHNQSHLDGSFIVTSLTSDRVQIDIGKPSAPSGGVIKYRMTYPEVEEELMGIDHAFDPAREIPIERRRDIPRADFSRALGLWPDYYDGVLTRQEFDSRTSTMHSTYIISIIHWLEENSK